MDNGALPILQVIDHLGPGGAQRQFVELAIGLFDRGYPLLVVALDDRLTEFVKPLTEHGIEVQLIRQSGKLDLTAARTLYASIKAFKPAVIQTWLYTADMYGRAMAALYNAGRSNKAAVISSVRSAETDKRSHYVWVDRALRHVTDAFVVNATVLGDTLIAREWVNSDKIHTIYNGINFDYFSGGLPIENRIANKPWKVVFIGRLSREKRPDLFIEAAGLCHAQRQDSEYFMIGSGNADSYREQINDRGLNSVMHLQGFSDDIGPMLRDMDLLISCSEYEGCSNTILEAMAAGVAVIATDVGGNSELLRDNAGWLVAPDSAELIANAVLSAMNDDIERETIRNLARDRVLNEFSQDAMVSNYEALYRAQIS